MSRASKHLAHLLLVALVVPLLAVAAPAQRANDYLNSQDFQSSPPELTGLVEGWVDFVGFGEYERQGAQPFAAPVPPGLPADVTHIYIDIDSGGYVKPNGCLYVWSETFVWIEFSDGSALTWWHTQTSLSCPDGSVEVFDNVLATAGTEDPSSGSWSGWIRSYSREDLDVRRRASTRGSANANVSLSSLAALPRPVVGPDTDDVDITIAPGGVLDLRGLNGAAGTLFETTGPVVIRCDQILMDPGVQLTDLFSQPPIVLPGALVHELAWSDRRADFLDAGPEAITVRAHNLGNSAELVQFDWIDVLAWSFGSPQSAAIDPMGLASLQVPLQVPGFVPAGLESALQLEARFAGIAEQHAAVLVRAHAAPPAPQNYCTAKTNSQGCLPQIGASGSATVSGYDDFVILASNVLPDKNGLVFYGHNPAAAPFQGGTMCVQPPVVRTPLRVSTGGHPGSPCDGAFAFHLSQSFMALRGITAGQSILAQWWMRDPQATFGTGLTDACMITVGP